MKFILTVCCSLIFVFNATAQPAPAIEWQNTIGGDGSDYLWDIDQTNDSGFILFGSTSSGISGDKTEPLIGYYDYWLVKTDSTGNVLWDRSYGGTDAEDIFAGEQTADGGYILGGSSESNSSADKSEDRIGSNDYWVVKVDSTGDIEWENTIGGYDNDRLMDIHQTSDGGYIVGGWSDSNIGADKTENTIGPGTESDFWIIKLDASGSIVWENTIGGNYIDQLESIIQTPDGGYIAAGSSGSDAGFDKSDDLIGGFDYWIVKLNEDGDVLWDRTIGGTGIDNAFEINITSDGGYIIGGGSYSSISGDKTENTIGVADYWVLKLDSLGNIEWQNDLGGSMYENLTTVFENQDGNYIVCGFSSSDSGGDKTENNLGYPYSYDAWVIELDSIGNFLWENTIGGSFNDEIYAMQQTTDGGYIMALFSDSEISADKTENSMGYQDPWIVKLFPEDCIEQTYYADVDSDGFGDPASVVNSCSMPTGFTENNTDCNDMNVLIYPGADELCNSTDDNCNALIDEDLLLFNLFEDADGDNFGNSSFDTLTCYEFISGYVNDSSDCNDTDPIIFPGATEICNNADDNCNTEIDEGLFLFNLFADADGDNYGNNLIDTISCYDIIGGFVSDSSDCDVSNSAIYPGAPEIEDGLDNNCNDTIDEGFTGIEQFIYGFEFNIYPNPADDLIQIEIHESDLFNESATLMITDVLGKPIVLQQIALTGNDPVFTIDIKQFTAGIYSIALIADDHILSKSLFVK